MSHHSMVVQWSDEDQAFIANIPELPGLSAFGDTQEIAIKELEIAKNLYIDSIIADGESIPEPEVLKPFSGQLRLRLPKSLHASLAQAAQSDGISLNTHIINLLAERNAYKKVCQNIELLRSEISTFQNWAINTISQTKVFVKSTSLWDMDIDIMQSIPPTMALSDNRTVKTLKKESISWS